MIEKKKRKQSPAQLANLKSFDERSESELRALRSKGGTVSGEVRRAKRDFQTVLKALLDMPCATDPSKTNREAIAITAVLQSIEGDKDARKWTGEYSGEGPKNEEAEGLSKIAQALRAANGRV